MSVIPIGIDLGTNNSCVSFVDGDAIKTIPNPISKSNTHASVVYIPTNRHVVVGQEAINAGMTYPKQLIYCVKRLIGRLEVPTNLNGSPFGYNIIIDDSDNLMIEIPQADNTIYYSPVDISSFILSYLRRCAESFFNPPDLDTPTRSFRTAEKAVITVPAAFNSEQRRLTRAAARLAGLDCLRILSEPTAAAISYVYSHYHDPSFKEHQLDPTKPINLLMFDLGGGTFDVSIVSVAKEGFQVRSTSGNNQFGGEDIDTRIAEDIKRQYIKECGLKGYATAQFPTTEKALRKLRKEAQKLKETLSEQLTYTIEVEKVDWDLLIDFKWVYQRSRLDALLSKEFERGCVPIVYDALNKASLTLQEINQCVLVGGPTRIPYIRNTLEKLLNVPISRAINPDEAVSKGAAYLASFLVNQQSKKNVIIPSDTPNSPPGTGVSTMDFTQVSLARGELSAFSYSIGYGDETPACLITSGVELPASGEHTFFLRHQDHDKPLFDGSALKFYVYEGQDQAGQGRQPDPPRRLFEITCAKQKVETQVISFYFKLDGDGVLDVFIADEDELFQIPNIDLPEIQVMLHLIEDPNVTVRSNSQFRTGASPLPSPIATRRSSFAAEPNALQHARLPPVKMPANLRNGPSRPMLSPPPPPRAPIFERLPNPPELAAYTSIPPPPTAPPVIPATLADKFLNGYANTDFVYMRRCRIDPNYPPGSSHRSSSSATLPTPLASGSDPNPAVPATPAASAVIPVLPTPHPNIKATFANRPSSQPTTLNPTSSTLAVPDTLAIEASQQRRDSNPFNRPPPPSQAPPQPTTAQQRRDSNPFNQPTLPTPPTRPTEPASNLPSSTLPPKPLMALPTPPQSPPNPTPSSSTSSPAVPPRKLSTLPPSIKPPPSLPTMPHFGQPPPKK